MSTPQTCKAFTVIVCELVHYRYDVDAADPDAAVLATKHAISNRGFEILSGIGHHWDCMAVLNREALQGGEL